MEKTISLVDQAYEDIKNMICNFELIPGQIVSDFTLSKKMGMSRTPDPSRRCRSLEGDDLIVDAGAGKSYQVSPITEDGIIDLFDAREGIEVAAVRIALEKGIDETRLIELERINRNMEDANIAGRIKENFEADQQFHDYLVNLSRNKKLIRFHESLLLQCRRVRYGFHIWSVNIRIKHTGIIKYLEGSKSGDSRLAQQALAEHIETARLDYLRVMKEKNITEDFGMLRFFR